MKLDRKEIKALETITIAGEGKNMVESGAVTNVVTFGDEVVVDLVLHTCTSRKEQKTTLKNNPRLSFARSKS
jgi:hypothetical protein